MSRTYSLKTMLRQVRPGLLMQYCRGRQIDLGVNPDSLGKDAVEVLAAAVQSLPAAQQSAIDVDFSRIAHLACRAGSGVLLEVARERSLALHAELEGCRTHQERAMHVFCRHRSLFAEAEARLLMDGASEGRWKRSYVKPNLSPPTATEELGEFDRMVREYYARESAGRFNHVDVYLRRDPARFCYFVYPEDQSRGEIAYTEEGELVQRTRRSAMELVFVYQPRSGLVELLVPGGREAAEELLAIFSQTVLGMREPATLCSRPPFNLELLKDRGFEFAVGPEDGIRSIFITELCCDLVDARGNQVTYRARANDFRPKEVYAVLERTLNQRQLTADDLRVRSAGIRAVFEPVGEGRPRVVAFKLTAPEGSTLKDDRHDQILKSVLERSGIAGRPEPAGVLA